MICCIVYYYFVRPRGRQKGALDFIWDAETGLIIRRTMMWREKLYNKLYNSKKYHLEYSTASC